MAKMKSTHYTWSWRSSVENTFFKVAIADFDDKIWPRRAYDEPHIETHWLKLNEHDAIGYWVAIWAYHEEHDHGNGQFQTSQLRSQRWKWEFPDGEYHNDTDHIVVN